MSPAHHPKDSAARNTAPEFPRSKRRRPLESWDTGRSRQPVEAVSDKVSPGSRILVGICSCRGNQERRKAVRETWRSRPVEGIECLFFVGGKDPLPGECDTLALDAPDGYEELPAKVIAFFRAALGTSDFEWLFKCDDDTYLALDRLHGIATPGADLIGNEFVSSRGSPSGGAGYLLSRRIVEKLVADTGLPATGMEDIIIGEAAARHGAKLLSTSRLCWSNKRFPSRDNHVITSHWCSPERLRAIHAGLYEEPEIVEVRHPRWHDHLLLFPGGSFSRTTSRCCGTWESAEEGEILLKWSEGPEERLVPIQRSTTGGGPGKRATRCFRGAPSPGTGIYPPAIPMAVDSLTPRHICVWLTTSDYGLPHLDGFLRSNPGVPVHVVSNPRCTGKATSRAWRNGDRLIRDWWLLHGRHLTFEHAVFLEWDVVFRTPLDEVFPGDADFYGKDVERPGEGWCWFREIPLLPEKLRDFATGVVPLGVIRVSRRCLAAMFSHPEAEVLYRRDIFCELRFATLAAACGYIPQACPGTLPHVAWHEVPAGRGKGVWHAVKSRA